MKILLIVLVTATIAFCATSCAGGMDMVTGATKSGSQNGTENYEGD